METKNLVSTAILQDAVSSTALDTCSCQNLDTLNAERCCKKSYSFKEPVKLPKSEAETHFDHSPHRRGFAPQRSIR